MGGWDKGNAFCAEGTGFEPVRDCSQPVFETGALNLSANPPIHSLFQSSYCRAPFSRERLAECLPPRSASDEKQSSLFFVPSANPPTLNYHNFCVFSKIL